MKWCLENHAALSAEARLKVMNNYTEERVAGQYIELYQRILKNSN
jgi:glycosyltransferase involved in cell wall biosynthesis